MCVNDYIIDYRLDSPMPRFAPETRYTVGDMVEGVWMGEEITPYRCLAPGFYLACKNGIRQRHEKCGKLRVRHDYFIE
jgi:hypothetical protein